MEKHEIEIAGCLRRLLRTRYGLRSRNETWFRAIVDHRKKLQSVLSSLAAQLEINESLGVATLRPVDDDLEEKLGFQLLRTRALSAASSVLILHLRWRRHQFYVNPVASDAPQIDILEMREYLQNFSALKIDSHFERTFRKCIEELSELQILIETSLNSELFEISPLCEILLPSDEIQNVQLKARDYFAKVVPAATEEI